MLQQLSRLAAYQDREPPLLATGWVELDALIAGWPTGCITEIHCSNNYLSGIFNPLLEQLADGHCWTAWVDPPHLPYALAGQQALIVRAGGTKPVLWTVEQVLASGACRLVLAWPGRVRFAEVRRLQLAAAKGGAIGVLFLPADAGTAPSPATLRLSLDTDRAGDLTVRILKRRGHWSGGGSARITR